MMNNQERVIDNVKNIIKLGWVESKGNGYGAAGYTFEKLLKIPTNNFEIPDYCGIEIKTKISKKFMNISLIGATPDSYLFVIKDILGKYGYYSKKDNDTMVFYSSFTTLNRTFLKPNRYGQLYVDYLNKKVILKVTNYYGKMVDDSIFWSFDLLKEKLCRKDSYLLIIYGDRKYYHSKVYFRYNSFDLFELKGFNDFLIAIEIGKVIINFNVLMYRNNNDKIYDHGTTFNLNCEDLTFVFKKIS